VVKVLPLALAKSSTRLAVLQLNPGHLLPVFDSLWLEYQVYCAFEDSSLTITAASAFSSAIMRLGKDQLISGAPSKLLSLKVGENNFSIKVAIDTASTVYTVKAVRAAKSPRQIASSPR
jgi:hypothetical protein